MLYSLFFNFNNYHNFSIILIFIFFDFSFDRKMKFFETNNFANFQYKLSRNGVTNSVSLLERAPITTHVYGGTAQLSTKPLVG